MQSHHTLVRQFFAGMQAGAMPDGLFTDDLTGWTTTQGPMAGARYLGAISMLMLMTGGQMQYHIDAITAEEDRAVAEVRSEWTLVNGEPYANTYVFAFRFRDGRISAVAEHFDVRPVVEKLIPLMQDLAAKG
jgi:uncharacterized protein